MGGISKGEGGRILGSSSRPEEGGGIAQKAIRQSRQDFWSEHFELGGVQELETLRRFEAEKVNGGQKPRMLKKVRWSTFSSVDLW